MEDRLADWYCTPRRDWTLPQLRDSLNAEFQANISTDEIYRKTQELKMNDRVRYDDVHNMWWVTGKDGANAWA